MTKDEERIFNSWIKHYKKALSGDRSEFAAGMRRTLSHVQGVVDAIQKGAPEDEIMKIGE